MKKKGWYRISIRMKNEHQDSLIGRLTALRFSGFLQENNVVHCYVVKGEWNSVLKTDLQFILDKFRYEIRLSALPFSITNVPDKNWNRTWEKGIGIVRTGSRIAIMPTWGKKNFKDKKRLIIYIDPKMSFGTGHHETTRLSLGFLERYIKPGMNVLDFGCGTGILSIAAVKLGARSATAIDNDKWAVLNTRENIGKNDIKRSIRLLLGSVNRIPRRKYDLIIANIDYQTISAHIGKISAHIGKKGIIIFSGILRSDIDKLMPVFVKYFLEPIDFGYEKEWSVIALRKA
jgi:ribosomal protein L11 methyltransferase